jgi:hypothetical protein
MELISCELLALRYELWKNLQQNEDVVNYE